MLPAAFEQAVPVFKSALLAEDGLDGIFFDDREPVGIRSDQPRLS
jgi:hypothetical protein